jgi:hypothetical protein
MPSSTKLPSPETIGLEKSFGFGDRLGIATPGHLAASRKFSFVPIFAQQSIREMNRTNRTPIEVMRAAQDALSAAGFSGKWSADADHLKTEADVNATAAAGFCFFTIDPSAFVENKADRLNARQLEEAVAELVNEGVLPSDWTHLYLDKKFEVSESLTLTFDRASLQRAAVKYARAIQHTQRIARHVAKTAPSGAWELEVSVDETDSPTSALEHLFFGLELQRRDVRVVSLAPRFIGEFEKGIDYKGDLSAFESKLREHVAIAKYCGPYKISIHSGSDKFAIYPIIGEVCGDLLHVKTAGTSYLEALRVVCRTARDLFQEIVTFSRDQFETDRRSYHISTTVADIDRAFSTVTESSYERLFLDEIPGRQLLHVTFGSVLTTGKTARGRSFHSAIMDILRVEADLHEEILDRHFTKHLSLLNKG